MRRREGRVDGRPGFPETTKEVIARAGRHGMGWSYFLARVFKMPLGVAVGEMVARNRVGKLLLVVSLHECVLLPARICDKIKRKRYVI